MKLEQKSTTVYHYISHDKYVYKFNKSQTFQVCEQIYNIIIQVIEKELSIIENKVTYRSCAGRKNGSRLYIFNQYDNIVTRFKILSLDYVSRDKINMYVL